MTKSKNTTAHTAVLRRKEQANRPKASDYFADDVHDEVDVFNKNREKIMLSGQAQASVNADDDDQVFQNRSVLGLDDDFDDGFDDYEANDDGDDDGDDDVEEGYDEVADEDGKRKKIFFFFCRVNEISLFCFVCF